MTASPFHMSKCLVIDYAYFAEGFKRFKGQTPVDAFCAIILVEFAPDLDVIK